jgi:hypothetical protein
MSGSGGTSGRVDVDSDVESRPDVCGSIVVDTTLNSPNADVVKDLHKGHQLDVEIQTSRSGVKSLVAKDASGRVAGALTPPSLIAIAKCIEGGYKYVALVLEKVAGGLVRVRIQGKR